MSRVRDLADNNVVFVDGITTADITEHTNLFFTDARADARLALKMVDEDNMSSNSAAHMPTQQSVKAYVDTEVASLVDSSPSTLDTLNELASALGDDANFSTTITNSIATKLPLAGGTLTGNLNVNGNTSVTANLPTFTITGQGRVNGFEIAGTASNTTLTEKSNNGLTFGTNNTPRMIIDNLGRVKIGTTSNTPASANEPGIVFGDNTAGTATVGVASFVANGAAPLLLTRRTNDGNVLGIADDTTTRGLLRVDGGDLNVSSNANLRLSAGGSSAKMTILGSNGNVGIGETNPAEKLEVSGNIKIDTGSTQYIDFKSGTSGALNYRIYNGIGWNSDAMLIYDHTNDATILTIEPGKLGINRGASSLTQAFEVNGSAWISGNVGIGTDVPADKMHIYNGAGTTVFRADVNANSTVGLEINKTGSTTQSWKIADGVTHNGALQFYDSTNSAVRIHIKSNGLIGIGTTSPTGTLHLHSADTALRLTSNQGSNTPLAQLQYSGSGGYFLRMGDSSNNEDVMIRTYGNSVFNGGNVGIGTASPVDKLHIYGNEGNSTMGIVLQDDGWGAPNGQYKLTVRNSDGAFAIRKNTSNNFDFATSDDHLVLTSSSGKGKLGINRDTNLDSTVTIEQATDGTNGGIRIYGSNSNSIRGQMYYDGSQSFVIHGTSAPSGEYSTLRFATGVYNNPQIRMSINKDNGNVGIGTTSPTEKLHVEGVVRADGYDTDSITSYNITGSYSAGTEYVFTTRSQLNGLGYGSGFYKFLVWSDTFHAGTSHYQCYTPYDEFYFNNYGSNTSTVQTMNYGVSMGHAPNTGTRAIDIRLRHKYGADATYPANQTFTFIPVNGFTNLNGNSGYHLRIYLFKVA